MLGAGLYVLVGIAAAHAGPSLWISYLVTGALTYLTVLTFCELARRMPVSGGGYMYAYGQLGSFWGFMVGWHLAVGSVFACALYANGFAYYAIPFIFPEWNSIWVSRAMAACLVIILIALQLRGQNRSDVFQNILTWGNVLVLLFLVAVSIPHIKTANFTPAFPNGITGTGTAISIIYISFFGYQLIANNSEEIKNNTSTVPKAMLLSISTALFIYLAVAVISIGVIDFRQLAGSNAPLVLVASRSLGTGGMILIGLGGILASGAALNSTISSQGRQIFAMGRDRLLPQKAGTLSGSRRIPSTALAVGAFATVFVILAFDLDFIAKAANFALLFSMLPVSVALHRIYAAELEEKEIPLWRRMVPWAAFAANVCLMLTLDWHSLLFGGTLVAIGCMVYITYSYSSEKRGKAGFSVSLSEPESTSLLGVSERILVPMANPDTQESLFSISYALLPRHGGEIVALNVVKAGESARFRSVLQNPEQTLSAVHLMQRIREFSDEWNVNVRSVVRAARKTADGICHAAVEERCSALVMGWSTTQNAGPSELVEEIATRLNIDTVFAHFLDDGPFRRIGVSLGGWDNVPLMTRVAGALAEQHAAELFYFNIMPENFDRQHLHHARRIQMAAIDRHTSLVPYHTSVLHSDNALDAIVNKSRELDLLVVGTTKSGFLGQESIGSFSTMIAQKADCSVAIVRRAPALRRIMAPRFGDIENLIRK